jgi:predicted PurR-regulated permease PerM
MSDESDKPARLEQILGLSVLFLLLIGCFFVMKPFISALAWAIVLCFSLWPVQTRLLVWLKGRRTLAALITTLTIATVLVLPFVLVGLNVADDARAIGKASQSWLENRPTSAPAWIGKIPVIGNQMSVYWTDFAVDAHQLMLQLRQAAVEARVQDMDGEVVSTTQSATLPSTTQSTDSFAQSKVVQVFRSIFSSARYTLLSTGLSIGQGMMEVALSVFLTFFIFRDGHAVAERLSIGAKRIAGDRGEHLLNVAGATVRGVVYGILGTAIVQSVMSAIGFLIAGVPGAGLLALLTFFLSPLPVGPPLVWIPASIWLFNQGYSGWGIFMLVWGVGVSSVDNVVKPWIISQGSDMPFILIFLGVLGGALAFGFIGVFLGPTLLAVGYRLIEEWSAGTTPPQTSSSEKPVL